MTAKKTPTQAFVTKAEFDGFASKTDETLERMVGLLESRLAVNSPTDTGVLTMPSGNPKVEKKPEPKDEAFANGFLPPQYEKIFTKYFDMDDGFTARITFPEVDDKGNESGGITFTIFVPEKFSNTTDAYRKMYKQDLRTRALLPHNIAKGIGDWCSAVAKNLKYNRLTKTK